MRITEATAAVGGVLAIALPNLLVEILVLVIAWLVLRGARLVHAQQRRA